jgi:putative ABC transport system permease protein
VAASVPSLLVASVPGIKTVLGRPAVSPEIHYNGLLKPADSTPRQALIRGVTPAALLVHPEVRLLAGRFPAAGEVMVGRLAPHKLDLSGDELQLGKRVDIGNSSFEIVGQFQAPGTVMEAEIWADVNDMRAVGQRDSLSCAVVRLGDATFDDVEIFTLQRLDLELVAMRESEYYAKLSAFYRPIRAMTWLTTALVAAGAIFGGFNTLYAAFASRIREMATLQAMGYTRTALLVSLLQECLLATLLGVFVAGAVALIFADGFAVAFAIGTFAIEITPEVLGIGVLGGAVLAILGALPPAWTCLKPQLPAALRSA